MHITGPGEMSVWIDTNVTLECVGKGVLEWLYSGSPLLGNVQASFHLSPFPRNGTNVLVLVAVSTAETGVYTCTNGTSFHSVSLFVKDGKFHKYTQCAQNFRSGYFLQSSISISYVVN